MVYRASIATRRSDNEITRIADAVTPSLDQDVGYDALSRLVRLDRYGVANHLSYDANGNHDRYQAGNALTRYTIDPHSNRALDYSNQDGSRQYQYDALGNRISETSGARTTTYTYNPFNRMAQSNVDGRVTDYLLNAQGQRVVKSNDAGTSRYYFAGQNQLLSELTNSTWTNYLWFGGELVGLVRNGNLINIHTDHLGRPAFATDDDQRTVWKAYNYAYGRSVTQDDIGGLNIGFPGQYYDAETGLWYNGFRDYDASIARYVQSDPIGLAGGINTYAYADGNPVSQIDPLGLASIVSFNNSLANIGWEVGANGRMDYVRVEVSFYVFHAARTFSKSGNMYFSGGITRSYPSALGIHASLSVGVLNQCDTPSGEDVDDHLRGYGMAGAAGYYGLGGIQNWSPGSGMSTQIGIGIGASVSPGEISNPDGKWGDGWK